jgi:calcyclin binding protein
LEPLCLDFQVKGEYSYDHWANLTGKRTRKAEAKAADPMGGLMDMMKDMYEEGDDQTRKIIGEAMVSGLCVCTLKQVR